MPHEPSELTPSRVLWAIIAVASLWTFGLAVLAVGFALTFCLGAGCESRAPDWVFVVSGLAGLGVILASGPVAWRLTRVWWAWLASVGGALILLLIVLGLRLS